MSCEVVELLDSDEEENPLATNSAPTPAETTPKPQNAQNTSNGKQIPPRNRPGPLSMKLKLGVPIETDAEIPVKPASPSVTTPDSGEDWRKQNKILTKLVDPGSKFLADFDPEHSIRERRKMVRKTGPPTTSNCKPGALYDENGIHRETGLDICDCLDMVCPGCHFPCESCKSNKCGPTCRANRKFMYETILFDGKDTEIKNSLIKR
ncbi:ARL14 effector protein [Culicoides brevitarsis]|uniref:ARL14 effector protein n=1 Tax=Culicoides brevitarsis TaxID=469753 RepID=UPI00307C4915